MKSCFIPTFSLWFVITDKLEFFRFFLPLDTFTFLCQMFPIHLHRIFALHANILSVTHPRLIYWTHIFLFIQCVFLSFFSSHFSNIFYHTKLHYFKKHVSNNFRLRQSSIRHMSLSIQNCIGALNNILFSSEFYLATNSVRKFSLRYYYMKYMVVNNIYNSLF